MARDGSRSGPTVQPVKAFPKAVFIASFTANRGKSWYPASQVEDDNFHGGGTDQVEIRNDRIRIYAPYESYNGVWDQYFVRWEGQLQIDSVAPAITEGSELPLAVPADTTLSISLTATDNDSLWLTQVVAWKVNTEDTLVIPLMRSENNHYLAEWHVQDTAQWHYYYHAEDMWENVSYYPTNGPDTPFELDVGQLSAPPPHLSPGEFTLSLFPNPANNSVTITGTTLPDNKLQQLFVFDILGREVARLTVPAATGGSFRIHWRLEDSKGLPLPTGSYFIIANDGGKLYHHADPFTVVR